MEQFVHTRGHAHAYATVSPFASLHKHKHTTMNPQTTFLEDAAAVVLQGAPPHPQPPMPPLSFWGGGATPIATPPPLWKFTGTVEKPVALPPASRQTGGRSHGGGEKTARFQTKVIKPLPSNSETQILHTFLSSMRDSKQLESLIINDKRKSL